MKTSSVCVCVCVLLGGIRCANGFHSGEADGKAKVEVNDNEQRCGIQRCAALVRINRTIHTIRNN